jgi:hypothetical protein
MKAVTHHVHGQLWSADGSHGRSVLLLQDAQPTTKTAVSLYLRYALVIMGPEEHVFPATLLDDWGHEVRGPEIYRFIREFGDQFPRAEIFGFDLDGSETQLFMRSLEMVTRWPCYVYTTPDAPLSEGVRLSTILLPTADIARPQFLPEAPETIAPPLAQARLKWWQVPAGATDFDFSLLDGA